MFPASYFAKTYFAGVYFPPVSGAAVIETPVRNPGGGGWGIELTPIIRPEDPASAKRRKQNNLLMILLS